MSCLGQELSRVTEQVLSEYRRVNELISFVTRVFLKALSRIAALKEMLLLTPLSPESMLTSNGT